MKTCFDDLTLAERAHAMLRDPRWTFRKLVTLCEGLGVTADELKPVLASIGARPCNGVHDGYCYYALPSPPLAGCYKPTEGAIVRMKDRV